MILLISVSRLLLIEFATFFCSIHQRASHDIANFCQEIVVDFICFISV